SITKIGEMKGSGEALISKLHAHLNNIYEGQSTVFSTLSPLRQPYGPGPDGRAQLGIDDFIEARAREWIRRDDVGKRALALEFLLAGTEGVERFHVGNGAVIGDINLDADTQG